MTERDSTAPAVSLSREEIEFIVKVGRMTVLEAGSLIRKRAEGSGPETVKNKAAFDFVTDVDRLCEELIVGRLQSAFPHHDVLSEEMDKTSAPTPVQWLVDPLDGTTNFIHGFPMIAVSMALVVEGVPVCGWVLDPLRRELFEAVRGEGSTLNGRPIGVRQPGSLAEALVGTGFPFRRKELLDPYLQVFQKVFREVSGVRRAGSAALDLAYTAAGRLDGFWEMGLKPWDVAAGTLLVEEAGGRVSDFWGGSTHVETGHIVAGSPPIHTFLLEAVRSGLAPLLRDQ
ncbi:myo-inositol-1(or 4)-monophosphatase [Desulfacinum hydrothermale DSM 13146]|uniref:Inositol-1-monophosphatase n=1 Tax=Desulfacinum hydrothermale DSM 13146 TaxID=1121390 RepID=A0A1W1XM02_9BACT|nr:inositol monophosphatase family protein [Desulfacinum hydrothermale]SMC24895.1 myo-inositol-1(or 4)-monophosphatase [Desulfacinum hydrothermale DSM 13146]